MSTETADARYAPIAAKSMKTKLFRYGVVDGVRTLRDSQIAYLFEKAKQENTLIMIMYGDDIEKINANTFVSFYKRDGRSLWLVFHDGKLAAWVCLDDFGHGTARMHFCTFKWLTRERLTIKVAREALWQLFDIKFRDGKPLRLIRGETPAFNKLAVRFVRNIGCKIIGEIPDAAFQHSTNRSYPMVYSYVTRDMLSKYMAEDYPETPLEEARRLAG